MMMQNKASAEGLLNGRTYRHLSEVIEASKKIKPLTPEAEQYIDLLAFMDTLLLAQSKLAVKGTAKSQHFDITVPLLMPAALDDTHWHLLYDNVFHFTQDRFKTQLSTLFSAAKAKLNPYCQAHVVLFLTSPDHIVALTQNDDKRYTLQNHGFITKNISSEYLIHFVFESFGLVNTFLREITLSVNVYTLPSSLSHRITRHALHPVIAYYFTHLRLRMDSPADDNVTLSQLVRNFVRQHHYYASYSPTVLALPPYFLVTFVRYIITWVLLHGSDKDKEALAPYYLFDQWHAPEGSIPEEYNELLWSACNNDNLASVKMLLQVPGLNINHAITSGITPLYTACGKNHRAIVQMLLQVRGININQATTSGGTPLSLACQEGHIAIVQMLLQMREININQATTGGATPLFIACREGHIAIVQMLLDRPEIDIYKAYKGSNPLDIAKHRGHHGIVRLFKTDACVIS